MTDQTTTVEIRLARPASGSATPQQTSVHEGDASSEPVNGHPVLVRGTEQGSPTCTEQRYRSTRKGWSDAPLSDHRSSSALHHEYTGEAAIVAGYVDREYYLRSNPDVAASDHDPVEHYVNHGWMEGRNPSPSFDTNYYLAANPDVAERRINPLWHYAIAGCAEGRQPSDKTAFRQDVLKGLRTADEKSKQYVTPDAISALQHDTIAALLKDNLHGSSLIVSISHDNYLRSIGGVQILVSDEQRRFQSAGADYLHLSPIVPRLRLATVTDGPMYFRLVLNGDEIGCVDASTLVATIRAVDSQLAQHRVLICHCILGHNVTNLVQLHSALRPGQSIFWVHDYSSICEGFNLLRNDLVFCGAPPASSEACRICIYGDGRNHHIDQLQTLFGSIKFDVVAPSEAAMKVWQSGSRLPCRSTHVIPHASTELSTVRRSLIPIEKRGTAEFPLRIAFVGHPERHKGWEAYLSLVKDIGAFPCYRFYHFATEDSRHPLIQHVPVSVTAQDHDAMTRALDSYVIDLVLVLSSCPETFSFVTYESIAAGADIIAFPDSGNVAAEVIRTGRGIVMQNLHDLFDFFVSGRAIDYVRLCYQQGNASGRLVFDGTTAAMVAKRPRKAKLLAAP